jgi:hypothetical protein
LFVAAGFLLLTAAVESTAQTRIRFARGRTSAIVPGSVRPQQSNSFLLRARQGQWLSANLSSDKKCVTFKDGASTASFTTTAGDNKLVLINSCRRTGKFVLTVSIGYDGQ